MTAKAPDPANDKFFFSPELGRLVLRGDLFYSEYGAVYSSKVGARMMPVAAGAHDNYANWTEVCRQKVQDAWYVRWKTEKSEQEAQQAQREALVKQARAKLTPEEFEAVYEQGFTQGRGY